MSNQQPDNISDRLRLGIEAARTGKENDARSHLIAVLKQDPNNIPAMLWLAFVLPSPHDTIRLLKRVVALDPQNERAKAGIRWARVRLGLPPEQPTDPTPQEMETMDGDSPADSPEESSEESIRTFLLSEEVQQQAKKGALAHRARRTINPFLGIFLISGALGLVAIGLGALLFVPPETLAAWMPQNRGPEILTLAQLESIESIQSKEAASASDSISLPSKTGFKSFTSETDTIIIPAQDLPDTVASLLASTELPVTAAELVPLNKSSATSIDPFQLIGPVNPFPAEKRPAAVDKALLAHQPAYPGEKWIEVNVTTQQVTAWEGDVPIMSFTVSTGLPNTPTVLGEFNIYWKLTSTLMVGADYYLPEVPYTMYFYAGYALHGTYWHSNFGQPMSHGCINLETSQAKQLFDWATPLLPPGQTEVVASTDNPGTLVVVHD